MIRIFPVRSPGPLAEPWRRLLAATLDMALIFAIHVVVVGWNEMQQARSDLGASIIAVASPLFCWLYVFAFWSLGQTPGMRAAGIRLVRDDMGRMSWKAAAIRIVGFVLACLPVKVGLLPIFYDAKRQGWHDRIARTLVVKAGSWTAADVPDRSPVEPLPPAPAPDMKAPLPLAWAALPLYCILVVWMTWPCVRHLDTAIMGLPCDALIFIWDYWYFQHALQTHQSLISTNLIFYPHQTSLALHTMLWFNCVPAAAMRRFMSLIAVYNVLNIATMTACAFCFYWMAASMGAKGPAALTIGGAFGILPYFLTHALGDANLLAAEFLPLFLLGLYAALVTLRARYAAWAGFWLALTGYCDLQHLAFGVFLGIVLLIGLALYHESPGAPGVKRRIVLLVGSFALAGVLLMPIALPAVRDMSHSSVDKVRESNSSVNRADLVDWITPSFSSRLLGGRFKVVPKDSVVTLGFSMLVLAATGAALSWRKRRIWVFVAVVFAVLASGPTLTIEGRGLPFWGLFVCGFPGSSFDLPWRSDEMIWAAEKAYTDPRTFVDAGTRIGMPFEWLSKTIPLLKPFRFPCRFGLVVLMCVALLAALGLSDLLNAAARRGRTAAWAAALLAAACLLAESYSPPYPMYSPPSLPFYERVAREAGQGAIVERPLNGNEPSAYGQTIHHRPLFKSFVSRHDSEDMATVKSNGFLASGASDETPERARGTLAAVRELKALGAEYVVYDVGRPWAEREAQAFERITGAPVVYDDGSTKAFSLGGCCTVSPSASADTARYAGISGR